MNRLVFGLSLIILATGAACGPSPAAPTQAGGTLATLVAQQLTAAVATPLPAGAGSLPTQTQPPAFAAGTLRVAYSQAGNLYLWDGGSSKQLTSSGKDLAPKFSADGRVLAFRRGSELWAVDADGSGERALVSQAALAGLPHVGSGALSVGNFDFAPASHDVYLNTILLSTPFAVPQEDLARVNADHPSLQPLLNGDQGGDEFTFSPDGTQIALVRNNKINVFRIDGAACTTVFTFPAVQMYSEQSYFPEISWMPDGSGFKTVIPAPDALGSPSAFTRFMYIPATGGQAAQLAEFVAVPAFKDRPYIAPDGAQVLYLKPSGDHLELHIIDASTADRAHFQHDANSFGILGWAPDSKHFTYWMEDTRQVWLASIADQPVPLGDTAPMTNLAWLDARRYLFLHSGELRMAEAGRPSLLIASAVDPTFDFSLSR